MKTIVRNAVADAVAVSGVGALLRRRRRRGLAVLCYHRVLPERSRRAYFIPELAVEPEVFSAHVAFCVQRFDCRPVTEALVGLRDNRVPTRPLLAFTFDDGYWDSFEYARPILNDHGVRATFFVISSLVGSTTPPWYDRLARTVDALRARSPQLDRTAETPKDPVTRWILDRWPSIVSGRIGLLLEEVKRFDSARRSTFVNQLEQLARKSGWQSDGRDRIMSHGELRQLASEGHEIGSHTRTHTILTRAGHVELAEELEGSRAELEAVTGRPVVSIAYPNGNHNNSVVRAGRCAGYRVGVTTQPGLNTRSISEMRLRRVLISQDRTSRPDGQCSINLLSLELCGAADTLFLRRLRRTGR